MSAVNQFSCLTLAGNTGVPECPVNWKNIYGFILTPSGAIFSATTVAAFITALQNAVIATNKASRSFPVYNLSMMGDSSEAPVIQTFPTGQRKRVRDGYYQWMFQLLNGGMGLQKRLRQFNLASSAHDVLFLATSDGGGDFIIGTTPPASSPNSIQAIPLGDGFFAANPWKASDGGKITDLSVDFAFNPKWVNENLAFVSMGVGFQTQNSIVALNDLYLSSPGAATPSGNFYVNVTDENNNDIGALYSTQLASASLWNAQNATSNAAIVPSAVTWTAGTPGVNNGLGFFTVTLPTTAPPYPTSGNVLINLTNPGALSTAGVQFFESTGPVSILKS